jgi:putative addiction module killer protein
MVEVRQTEEFSGWLRRLRDASAVTRIRRMEAGNPGDTKSVGQGILEMRIDTGRDIGSTMCIAEHKL